MSISHVFSSIVTQRKNEIKKNFRHIEIMIFTTFFLNRLIIDNVNRLIKSYRKIQNLGLAWFWVWVWAQTQDSAKP